MKKLVEADSRSPDTGLHFSLPLYSGEERAIDRRDGLSLGGQGLENVVRAVGREGIGLTGATVVVAGNSGIRAVVAVTGLRLSTGALALKGT